MNPEQEIIPLEVSLIISQHEGRPIIEIRKSVYNLELIKGIITCAFEGRPFMVVPKFRDKMRSIGTLTEKGILYREGDNFLFTF